MASDYNKDKWGELRLRRLIIDTDSYVVFIDDDIELDWVTSAEFDAKGHSDLSKHGGILNQVALLECRPNSLLSDKVRLDFKRLLGEALARSFSSDYETANEILIDAEIYLHERGEELSRKWCLSAAGRLALWILILGVVAWIFRAYLEFFVGKSFLIYLWSVVAGALGALLSIIMRLGKENLNCHAGKEIHELESLYRIIAGMLSAFFLALAVSSGIIFPALTKSGDIDTTLLVVGFVAGMSERFAPSISSRLAKADIS